MSIGLHHLPPTGTRKVYYAGDYVRFELRLDHPAPGTAWLRTNLGRAAVLRREIIRDAEEQIPRLASDWHDLPMVAASETLYRIDVPLSEVGRFEAKAFFLPHKATHPTWPDGGNVIVKVEPADYAAMNTVYSAFVRQFAGDDPRRRELDPTAHKLEENGYTVVPRSGKFRDLVRQLDFIVHELGFRIIQLLPIHPTPTTYAKMGRFGSPFASLDFFDVDPSLAEFDRQTTPLDQFRELAAAVHARAAKLFLDMPINHTGWASWLQIHHPEWFARNEDRSFQSPGAWGVTWEDLSRLDYRHHQLWHYMADVFLYWCRQGVDGFRCDAGYMVPYPVWEYIIARVRTEYPDTIFLLEGLGGKIEVMESLLDGANLDWAYSELFQNYTRPEVEGYLPHCMRTSAERGLLVHFAETHDNNRLAAVSAEYARMRTALCALAAPLGGLGITNGVEWLARDKVYVHDANPLNWGGSPNLVEHLGRLTGLLATHPAFGPDGALRMLHGLDPDNTVAFLRTAPHSDAGVLLVAANLAHDAPQTIAWNAADFDPRGLHAIDLLTGHERALPGVAGNRASIALAPGEVVCFSTRAEDAPPLTSEARTRRPRHFLPPPVLQRKRRLLVLRARAHLGVPPPASEHDLDVEVERFWRDPEGVLLEWASGAPRVTTWRWSADTRRVVLLPAGNLLRVEAPYPFRVELRQGESCLAREMALPSAAPHWFALVGLPEMLTGPAHLYIKVYEPNGPVRGEGTVLCLPPPEADLTCLRVEGLDAVRRDLCGLSTNDRGGMAVARAAWPEVRSQYDALLAANLNPDYPEDRRILFTRCRAWVQCRGYSHEVNRDCLTAFGSAGNRIEWEFRTPAGMGRFVRIQIVLTMPAGRNVTRIDVTRLAADPGDPSELPCNEPVRLVLRPDIEDRGFHDQTKAYAGPEATWPGCVKPIPDGFVFAPSPHHGLRLCVAGARFAVAPEWSYMVHHPIEAERGIEPHSDLFSPGYFSVPLPDSNPIRLEAEAFTSAEPLPRKTRATPARRANPVPPTPAALADVLGAGIRQFVVRRDNSRTVIAGYPWFLDWGRDTLICLRGMVAAGLLEESLDILCQFGTFEERGTLPNMIRGSDVSNRDTSDAPLWFFAACRDLCGALGADRTLAARCGKRSVADVLRAIADGYLAGTPNGIRVDAGSGLVFSPSHFTWMDTNFPAGTPRQGYPVEIQALWFHALDFLASLEPKGRWADLRDRVQRSIEQLYVSPRGDLYDSLAADPGTPAEHAVRDDALRPNQLFAITLGAVREPHRMRAILAHCEELLVPGAIRTLADRPVSPPLPIWRDGRLLNNPERPYRGYYTGDEDTSRKPAYHNGTAWTWPFPSYCEALVRAYGDAARPVALSLLRSATELLNDGCVGQLPEIIDGDAPHTQRGCMAQAWSMTEVLRVLRLLT